MSGYRELYTLVRDRIAVPDALGRIPFKAAGPGPIDRPLVSEHLHGVGFRPYYPGGATFALCASHDIDILMTPTFREKLGTIRQGGLAFNLENLKGLFQRYVDPRYSIDRVLELERALGVRSSFYFLSLEHGDEDFNYDVREVADQFKMVTDSGNEIGLHGGHGAYNDASVLAREKNRLMAITGTPPAGYRNHYLRFDLERTWSLLWEAGFIYDTTIAYSDQAGFRNGMCYPHRPMDPINGSFLPMIELPLTIMDVTVLSHMGLDRSQAMELCKRLVLSVKGCGGVITILWHNTYMHTSWGSFYRDLLSFCMEHGAWSATTGELVEHWVSTGQLGAMEAILSDHTLSHT
jgi:peptidoglycan/xylan/chitin deacetylase (PgdA/CDA1 family)